MTNVGEVLWWLGLGIMIGILIGILIMRNR